MAVVIFEGLQVMRRNHGGSVEELDLGPFRAEKVAGGEVHVPEVLDDAIALGALACSVAMPVSRGPTKEGWVVREGGKRDGPAPGPPRTNTTCGRDMLRVGG